MNTELFSCPFCGNRAELKHEHTLIYITCINSDCKAEVGGFQSEQCAIDAWNTRHDVPRAAVQAAVDEMVSQYWRGIGCINGPDGSCKGCAHDKYPIHLCRPLACVQHFTGVTPSEVTPCEHCAGHGVISCNQNTFQGHTSACTRCGGTGVTPSEVQ